MDKANLPEAPASRYSVRPNPQFGFIQVHPTPSPEEITRYYADEFYSSAYKQCNNSSLEVIQEDAAFYKAHYQDMLHGIEEVLGRPSRGLDVLDIGCGWGQALLHFKGQGLQPFGFDPAPEAVAYGRRHGLEVVRAGMETMQVFGDRRFDVVTLMNVLEHLADPVETLREIRTKVLRAGGVLVVEVPNDYNAWQVAGRKLHDLPEWWVAPPAHLNYFSGETLTRTLQGAGFDVRVLEASFPLEMFLLFGRNYPTDPKLGKQGHKERVAFEANLRAHAGDGELRRFYRGLAAMGLGRQVMAFARNGASA